MKIDVGLSGFTLKWIAVITMLLDHCGKVLFPREMAFVMIGRLSFPIFCFLLVEGFHYTSNRRSYLLRLGAFALISDIPYDLAFQGTVFFPQKQNVFFSLLIACSLLCVLEKECNWLNRTLEIMLAMWVSVCLKTDYSFYGIGLVCWFYFFRERRILLLSGGAFWNFLWVNRLQWYGAFAMVPIGLYSGKKGRGMKYFFYWFYPLHLLALYVVKRIIT